jgi:hypothetical protein
MRFGIFFELSVPRPFTRAAEHPFEGTEKIA